MVDSADLEILGFSSRAQLDFNQALEIYKHQLPKFSKVL